MNQQEFTTLITQEYVLDLYIEGQLTLQQSAACCHLNIYEFMTLLTIKNIPIIPPDIENEELENELKQLSSYFF